MALHFSHVSADTRNPHSIAAGVPAEISEIDLFAGTINYQNHRGTPEVRGLEKVTSNCNSAIIFG